MLLRFALRFIAALLGAAALGVACELLEQKEPRLEFAFILVLWFALPAGSWAATPITNETELGLHRKRANPKMMLAVMVMGALMVAFAAGKFLVWKP